MPSHKVHRILDRMIFGREYPDVHNLMDITAPVQGSHHRTSISHNPLFILAITRDRNKFLSAMLHQALDMNVSYAKNIYEPKLKKKVKSHGSIS
jgi:hypothetical protein